MKITYIDEQPKVKITYLDKPTAQQKQNPNLGDQITAGASESPLLTDIGSAVSGLANKFNPNMPTAEEYRKAAQDISQSIPQPQGWGGKIARGSAAVAPDLVTAVPVIGAVGKGLQVASKAPLLTRFGGRVASRALASPIAQMGAGMGAYEAGKKVLTGQPQEAIPAGLSSAASGAAFGIGGKLGAQALGSIPAKVAPKLLAATNRIGSGAGQAAVASVMGQNPILAGAMGAIFPSKFNGKALKSTDQQIVEVVKKGVSKGVRPAVQGKPSAVKTQAYYDKTADGVKAIIANKGELQFVDNASGEIVNRLPHSVADFAQAIEQTKNKIFNLYDNSAKQAGDLGARFNAVPTVNQLKRVSKDLKYSPDVRQYATKLISEIEELHGQSPEIIQARIKELNNSLSSFYAGRTSKAQAEIDASVANLMRQELDDMITSATGKNYQQYKNIYGALKTAEKDINRRATVLARQNPKSLADLTDIFSGERIISGILTANPASIGTGIGMNIIKRVIKRFNDPDLTIKKMFTDTDKILSKVKVAPQRSSNIIDTTSRPVDATAELPSPRLALPQSENIYGEGFSARKPQAADYIFKKGQKPWNAK